MEFKNEIFRFHLRISFYQGSSIRPQTLELNSPRRELQASGRVKKIDRSFESNVKLLQAELTNRVSSKNTCFSERNQG